MSLTPDQAIQAILIAIETDIPLMMWGESGIGKSDIVRQALTLFEHQIDNKTNYTFTQQDVTNHTLADLRLAHCDISDWGLPRIFAEVTRDQATTLIPVDLVKDTDNVIDFVHQTTRPSWLPHRDYEGLYVLFLDELNRGDKFAKNAVMELLAERRLRGRELPKHSRLVAACNPSSDGFFVEELDTAMKARWCHIEVKSNHKTYIESRYTFLDDISRAIVLDQAESLIKPHEDASSWEIASEVEYRPRTWEMHARLANYVMQRSTKDPAWLTPNMTQIVQHMISGLIGMVSMRAWWDAFISGRYLSLEKLLNGSTDYAQLISLGTDKISSMATIIKCLFDDTFLYDTEPTSFFADGRPKPSKMRARNFLNFLECVLADRKELASMLAHTFVAKMNNPNFKYCHMLLEQSEPFAAFTREANLQCTPI